MSLEIYYIGPQIDQRIGEVLDDFMVLGALKTFDEVW